MPLSSRRPNRQHNRPLSLPITQVDDAEMPIDRLGATGVGSEAAYEVITSELLLDGQARLNLATFVTTWMPALGASSWPTRRTRT